MAAQDVFNFHRERLTRILEESLDVALILCNSEWDVYTVAEIFDIIDQIIPTAFILNTGFWPFFSSSLGQCLCICGRYGIYCRHHKTYKHWIDLQKIAHDTSAVKFYPKDLGQVQPLDYRIQVEQIIDDVAGYNITINLKLHHKKYEKGNTKKQDFFKKRGDLNDHKYFDVLIRASYKFLREFYPSIYTTVFRPNPFFLDFYGSYFATLIQKRSMVWPHLYAAEGRNNVFMLPANELSDISLILCSVMNLPTYSANKDIVAVIYPTFSPSKQKLKRGRRQKCFKENVDCAVDTTLPTYLDEWKPVLFGKIPYFESVVESIKSIENTNLQDFDFDCIKPIKIENSDEYDNQIINYGFDKTIQKSTTEVKELSIISNDHRDCSMGQLNFSGDEDFNNVRNYHIFQNAKNSFDNSEIRKIWNHTSNTSFAKNYDNKIRNSVQKFLPQTVNKTNYKHNSCSVDVEKKISPPKLPARMTKEELDEEFAIIQEVIDEDIYPGWWHEQSIL